MPNQFPLIIVAAYDNDGYGRRDQAAIYVARGPAANLAAVEAAIAEYVLTDDGQRLVAANGEFNWGDAAQEIPTEFWSTHKIVFTYLDGDVAIVDHDHNFASTDDDTDDDTDEGEDDDDHEA